MLSLGSLNTSAKDSLCSAITSTNFTLSPMYLLTSHQDQSVPFSLYNFLKIETRTSLAAFAQKGSSESDINLDATFIVSDSSRIF